MIQNSKRLLKCFAWLTSHLSHSVRTPLGVGLGLVCDLKQGYALSKQDLDDGENSLTRIKNQLCILSNYFSSLNDDVELVPADWKVLIRDTVTELNKNTSNKLEFDYQIDSKPCMINPILIKTALQKLFIYVSANNHLSLNIHTNCESKSCAVKSILDLANKEPDFEKQLSLVFCEIVLLTFGACSEVTESEIRLHLFSNLLPHA